MPVIKIDDQEYNVQPNQNLIMAAAEVGVKIPHYCYHPGLSVDGNCRMCLVEIKGPRGTMAQIACNTPVTEGLEVITKSDNVKQMRQGVMEFLLLNHPIDCPICDQAGECRLQDYYMNYGLYDNRSTVPKVHKDKVVDVGPQVVLDQERCILCSRCVRFCQEITHTNELVITGRGEKSRIEIFPGQELDNAYSMNVVDICPVGALTSKDFRFKKRVWFLQRAKSVCMGCARGCNIELDHEKGQAYRYRPRENPAVNQYWMCDEGRLSYKNLNENRLFHPLILGEEVPLAQAQTQASEMLLRQAQSGGTDSVVAIGSPDSSLEDNFALQHLMAQALPDSPIWAVSLTPEGQDDGFLKMADQSPNRQGLNLLQLNQQSDGLKAALSSGKIKVLLVLNNELNEDLCQVLSQQHIKVIYLGTHVTHMAQQADVALPITTHAEHYGSYINAEQRLQKVFQAWSPTTDIEPAWAVLAKLLAPVLPEPHPWQDVEDVWIHLRRHVPGLENLSFYDIPDSGLSLAPVEESIHA